MTLPPDEHDPDDLSSLLGDEIDPLKWLESLAARQGANPEEFVTSADLDIPEADPNAVIDEPGYVEYDPFGSGKKPTPAAAPPPVSMPPATIPTPRPEPMAAAPRTPVADPMTGGVDPLAWLESLAKRQGANPEEFVTAADLEVAEVDPNTVIDEPGYTPYETGAPAAKAKAAPPPPPPPVPTPAAPIQVPEPETLEEGELTADEAAAILGLDADQLIPVVEEIEEMIEEAPQPVQPAAPKAVVVDPMAGDVDPLAWLESLARRQGAKSEELITAADLNIPEAAADAVVDEPGYVDYSPFGVAEEAEEEPEPAAAAMPEMPAGVLEEEPAVSGDDTLAWLEGLAEEQGALVEEFPFDEIADPLAGMSDEEIEQRAAAGELSAEQMEAWLTRQAASLAQTRADAEFEYSLEEETGPAERAEIPSWLQEAMPGEESVAGEPAPLVEEIMAPPEPADLPDWLAVPEQEGTGAELMDMMEEEIAEVEGPKPAYDDSWAQALDEEYDSQRMNLEEEPEWYRTALQDPRRLKEVEAGIAAEEVAPEPEETEEEIALPERSELPDWLAEAAPEEAYPAEEMPDWLTEPIPATEIESLTTEQVEDWLDETDIEEEKALAPAEMPDWLMESVPEQIEVPDWLAEAAPEPVAAAPEPKPEARPEPVPTPTPVRAEPAVPAAPTPVVKPTAAPTLAPLSAAVPQGAAYDSFRASLGQNPQDHATRLLLARKLNTDSRVADALGQYEALASSAVMLDDIEKDLADIIKAKPDLPQAHRVLGDVFMRKGRLQDALDTYRAALEQL